MLYVYDFYDVIDVEKCKDLKQFDDCHDGFYISQKESIIIDGKELKPKGLLCDFLNGWYSGASEYMGFSTILGGDIELEKSHAIEILSDDLRLSENGENKYEERILNAEEPAEEVGNIINELGLVVLDMFMEEIKHAYTHIKTNGFEWK